MNEWEKRLEASRIAGMARVEVSPSESQEQGHILEGIAAGLHLADVRPYGEHLVYSDKGFTMQAGESGGEPHWRLMVYLKDAPYLHAIARSFVEAEANAEREAAPTPRRPRNVATFRAHMANEGCPMDRFTDAFLSDMGRYGRAEFAKVLTPDEVKAADKVVMEMGRELVDAWMRGS